MTAKNGSEESSALSHGDTGHESDEAGIRAVSHNRQSHLASLVTLAAHTILFAILNRSLLRPQQLTVDEYEEPIVSVAVLRAMLTPSIHSLVLACIVLLLLFRSRCLLVRWSQFPNGQAVRVVVGVSAFLLAWTFSTYDFNHFFGRSHLLDRVLLVFLFLAIVWRPVFVFPFLVLLWPLVGQFNVPIGGYSWAIAFLPARVLLLFFVVFTMGLVTRKWDTASFSFLLICLVAAHFFPSGLRKLEIGWLLHDQIHYLLPNTYAGGWLGFLDRSTIETMTNGLSIANWPVKLFTLAIECGADLLPVSTCDSESVLMRVHRFSHWRLSFVRHLFLAVDRDRDNDYRSGLEAIPVVK